jgi:hypothetical protein
MAKIRVKHGVAALAAIALMLPCAKAATTVAMSFSGNREHIPFGKTHTEVIAWLESMNELSVYEDHTVGVSTFYRFSALQPFLALGVQSANNPSKTSFYPHFTKKYTVERSHTLFPSTFRMDLYFVRGAEQAYRLFMVYRVCRVEAGSMQSIFQTELEEREKKNGKPAGVWQSSYLRRAEDKKSERALPAQVAQYTSDNSIVFFMMNDNGMLQFKEFLYVCAEGWSSYLRQLEKAEAW